MHARTTSVAMLLVAACATDVAGAAAGLDVAPAGTEVLARRGDDLLVALPAPVGPPGTDVRPARPLWVRLAGAWREPPAPAWTGALVGGGVAWVTTDGALVVVGQDGAVRELARDVIPELATSPSGRVLAFAKRPGPDAGVYVWDGGAPRCVTHGLGVADRPLFADERRLVVVGAPRGGIAGIWLARSDALLAAPLAVTNASLRTGHALGAGFVPPPADHASMRLEAGALVYDDGAGTRRVALPQEVRR